MDIEFVVRNGLNALLVGKHGIGKTTRPRNYLDQNKIPYLFFNCPTMDVYEDVRGFPVERDGKINYIKPETADWDNAQYVILDEPNRAHLKVVNALYELIQFHTINGRHFPNLRGVIATMNPPDDNYTVETVDQSFIDRFDCVFYVEAELDKQYLQMKYPFITNEMFTNIYNWWTALPQETRDKNASPRRVDYAIGVFAKGGKVSYSIPRTCSPATLQSILESKQATSPSGRLMMSAAESAEWFNSVTLHMKNGTTESINPNKIMDVPDEILCSWFNRNTKDLSNAFATVFQQQWKKLIVSTDLSIALAKNRRVQADISKSAGNHICTNFPSLARACNIVAQP